MAALQAQQQAGQQPPAAGAAAAVAPAAVAAPTQGQPHPQLLQQQEQQQQQNQAEKKQKQKQKQKKEQPGDERPPGKCHFYLQNKRRHCKFDAIPGKRFCGNHMFEGEGAGPRRVPCPWDPRGGHSVLESELEKHKLKCPGYLQDQANKAQPFFAEDINAGPAGAAVVWPAGLLPAGPGNGGAGSGSSLAGQPADAGQQQQQQVAKGPKGHAAMQAAFAASLGEERFEEVVQRVEAACQQICEAEPLSALVPPAAEPLLLPESANEHRPFSLKHAQQQASIVGNMRAWGLLEGAGEVTYVEYGAGKGYLSEMLSACSDARKLVVMDVRGFKHKADRGMRHLELQRLRCDIKDFDVAQVPGMRGGAAPWVAFGKHLCGAATDFTLRSCARELQRQQGQQQLQGEQLQQQGKKQDEQLQQPQEQQQQQQVGGGAVAEAPGGGVRGLAIATCCHHRCCWQHFVGQHEMEELGFSPQEFEVIAWMTGWALCAHEAPAGFGGDDMEQDERQEQEAHQGQGQEQQRESGQQEAAAHTGQKRGREEAGQPAPAPPAAPAGAAAAGPGEPWRPQAALPRARKIAIGGRCKRLIDAARLRWLRRQGFAGAGLVQYVAPSVSGENRLLLAVAAARGGMISGGSADGASS
ncbi:hypothetical protein ABPG75_010754 [Micractinium tetrahymenae]